MSIQDLTVLRLRTQSFFIVEALSSLWLFFGYLYSSNDQGRAWLQPTLLIMSDIVGLKPRPTDINVFRLKFVVNNCKAMVENGF